MFGLLGGTPGDSTGRGSTGTGTGGTAGSASASNIASTARDFCEDRTAARVDELKHACSSSVSSCRIAGFDKDFSIRSDIHVLVVGDPGLGKSQLLRAVANIAPRAVFVCGNTATAAGLTVSVCRY